MVSTSQLPEDILSYPASQLNLSSFLSLITHVFAAFHLLANQRGEMKRGNYLSKTLAVLAVVLFTKVTYGWYSQRKSLVLQTFKRHLSFLLSAIYVCAFLLFLLSLNIFNICFQWFTCYYSLSCVLHSQVLLHNPAHALLFCNLGILYLCHFWDSSSLHPTCAI